MIDLKRLRKKKKMTQSMVAELCGIDRSRLSKYESGKDVSVTVTDALMKTFEDWKDFYVETVEQFSHNSPRSFTQFMNEIIHVPIMAQAGFVGGEIATAKLEDTENYTLPNFKDKGYSFEVKGESMESTLLPGECVVTSRTPISNYSEIKDGWVYVIETHDGILIKRLFKNEDKDKLILRSDNNDFIDKELPMTEVKRIFKGRRFIKYDLSYKNEK